MNEWKMLEMLKKCFEDEMDMPDGIKDFDAPDSPINNKPVITVQAHDGSRYRVTVKRID